MDRRKPVITEDADDQSVVAVASEQRALVDGVRRGGPHRQSLRRAVEVVRISAETKSLEITDRIAVFE